MKNKKIDQECPKNIPSPEPMQFSVQDLKDLAFLYTKRYSTAVSKIAIETFLDWLDKTGIDNWLKTKEKSDGE